MKKLLIEAGLNTIIPSKSLDFSRSAVRVDRDNTFFPVIENAREMAMRQGIELSDRAPPLSKDLSRPLSCHVDNRGGRLPGVRHTLRGEPHLHRRADVTLPVAFGDGACRASPVRGVTQRGFLQQL